jgi:DNA-binding transcriptional ArsR family regulator
MDGAGSTNGLGQTMGVRDAARALGLNPSTVSRQLDKFVASGLLTVEERDGKKLFDVDGYRRAAGLVSNPLMARNVQPSLVQPNFAAAAPTVAGPNLQTAATAHKAYEAKLLKLKYDREIGAVVERAAVASVLETVARELRDGLLALPGRCKGELASMTDPAEIQRYLDARVRDLLAQLQAGFAKLAVPPERGTEPDVEPETQTEEVYA